MAERVRDNCESVCCDRLLLHSPVNGEGLQNFNHHLSAPPATRRTEEKGSNGLIDDGWQYATSESFPHSFHCPCTGFLMMPAGNGYPFITTASSVGRPIRCGEVKYRDGVTVSVPGQERVSPPLYSNARLVDGYSLHSSHHLNVVYRTGVLFTLFHPNKKKTEKAKCGKSFLLREPIFYSTIARAAQL